MFQSHNPWDALEVPAGFTQKVFSWSQFWVPRALREQKSCVPSTNLFLENQWISCQSQSLKEQVFIEMQNDARGPPWARYLVLQNHVARKTRCSDPHAPAARAPDSHVGIVMIVAVLARGSGVQGQITIPGANRTVVIAAAEAGETRGENVNQEMEWASVAYMSRQLWIQKLGALDKSTVGMVI